MPQVQWSFYTDEHYGGSYWTFLSEELPALVNSWFNVSQRREDTFVAGLSMGGYGALKWALRQPERFAAAASLSGAVDVTGLRTERCDPRTRGSSTASRRERSRRRTDDLFWLLDRTDAAATPPVYLCCGTEDVLIDDNRAFADRARTAGRTTSDFEAGTTTGRTGTSPIQDVLARPSCGLPVERAMATTRSPRRSHPKPSASSTARAAVFSGDVSARTSRGLRVRGLRPRRPSSPGGRPSAASTWSARCRSRERRGRLSA